MSPFHNKDEAGRQQEFHDNTERMCRTFNSEVKLCLSSQRGRFHRDFVPRPWFTTAQSICKVDRASQRIGVNYENFMILLNRESLLPRPRVSSCQTGVSRVHGPVSMAREGFASLRCRGNMPRRVWPPILLFPPSPRLFLRLFIVFVRKQSMYRAENCHLRQQTTRNAKNREVV